MSGLPELLAAHPHVHVARAMFSVPELLIMLVIVLIIFGAKKLPQVGDSLGRAIKNFKRASATDEEEDEPEPEPAPAPAKKKQVAAKTTKQLEEADEAAKDDDDDEWEEVVVRRRKKKSQAAAEG